jgi:2-methylcitrate dehydratase PrpD
MLTDCLASFIADISTEDISDEVYDAARRAIIDTLGVALAGSCEPVAEIAADWVSETGAKTGATVWGKNLSSHSANAAFANGVSAHALDFDDSLPSGRGHMSACLVPTVLSMGEVLGSSGRDILAAYAIGLEISGVLGRVFGPGHQRRGWHPTATVGTFAATAAAAYLAGLESKSVARAFGIAGSQIAGLARNFGTMTKSFHIGRAAQSGVMAAGLVKKGLTSDGAIFDEAGNVIEIYAGGDGEPIEDVLSSIGSPWTILSPGNCVKRWPCCYSGHRTVAAMIELIERHVIDVNDVTEVSVSFLPGGDASLLSTDPQSGLEGKFSIEYIVAAMLLDGELKMNTFKDAMVMRPEARQLMQRVRRIHIRDEKFYSGISGYNDITIVTSSNRFEVREERVPGSRDWPLSAPEQEEKFIDCASLVLGGSAAADLLGLINQMDTADNIQSMMKATVPSKGIGSYGV